MSVYRTYKTCRTKRTYSSRNVRALSFHVYRIQRLVCGHEKTISFYATETEVAAYLGQQYLTDPLAIWRKDMNSVVAWARPTCGRPDIAVDIGSNPIGTPNHLTVFGLQLHRRELCSLVELPAIYNVPHFYIS